MADCSLLEKCIFFNDKMSSMPASADMLKKRFCLKDSSTCARYMVCVNLGRENVPADLFPNHIEQARVILGRA